MKSGSSSLRIIACGCIARGPMGGLSWQCMEPLPGLADLGHEVWLLEGSGDYPAHCDPERQTVGAEPACGLAYAQQAFDRIGFDHRWAFHDAMHDGLWRCPADDAPWTTVMTWTLALAGFPALHERLAAAGWNVVLGPRTTLPPNDYREFIAGSRGEVSSAGSAPC